MRTSEQQPPRSGEFLDWESAQWWARALTPAGPTVTRVEAGRVSDALRAAAAAAPGIVADVTGLHEASATAADFPQLVLDRASWGAANVEMFADLTGAHLHANASFVAKQGAALEIAGLLSLLATRVLGQFDPFSSRLYLVAPNIVATRRSLGVDEADFAMWVALHEQTHAVQFAAAPWLPEYLRSQMGTLLEAMAADTSARAWRTLRRLPSAWRNREAASVGLLTQAALNDTERERLESLVAVMSLLEGHADVVMDSAESQVPSTKAIRARFNRRRIDPGTVAKVLGRLVGMDAKLRQYRDGARFVTGVTEEVGHAGLNLVFAAPENLPTPAEIAYPRSWVERVAS